MEERTKQAIEKVLLKCSEFEKQNRAQLIGTLKLPGNKGNINGLSQRLWLFYYFQNDLLRFIINNDKDIEQISSFFDKPNAVSFLFDSYCKNRNFKN